MTHTLLPPSHCSEARYYPSITRRGMYVSCNNPCMRTQLANMYFEGNVDLIRGVLSSFQTNSTNIERERIKIDVYPTFDILKSIVFDESKLLFSISYHMEGEKNLTAVELRQGVSKEHQRRKGKSIANKATEYYRKLALLGEEKSEGRRAKQASTASMQAKQCKQNCRSRNFIQSKTRN